MSNLPRGQIRVQTELWDGEFQVGVAELDDLILEFHVATLDKLRKMIRHAAVRDGDLRDFSVLTTRIECLMVIGHLRSLGTNI